MRKNRHLLVRLQWQFHGTPMQGFMFSGENYAILKTIETEKEHKIPPPVLILPRPAQSRSRVMTTNAFEAIFLLLKNCERRPFPKELTIFRALRGKESVGRVSVRSHPRWKNKDCSTLRKTCDGLRASLYIRALYYLGPYL